MRYKPTRVGFWWKIKVGTGTALYGRFYTQNEAQRMCNTLLTAYRDGEFAGMDAAITAEQAAKSERLQTALEKIARHTSSDDPCRHFVDIARDALAAAGRE